MALYELDGVAPSLGEDVWVAQSAQIIGKVILGRRANVWFCAVARGDSEALIVGPESNVQDGAVLHADPGCPLVIGEGVSIGHQAVLHGCVVGNHSLIGIQATILNRARIGKHCIVGAGALVTEGKEFPDYSLIMGSPAKVVRTLDPEGVQKLERIAQGYVERANRYRRGLRQYASSEVLHGMPHGDQPDLFDARCALANVSSEVVSA